MKNEINVFDFSIRRNISYYYLMSSLIALYQITMLVYGCMTYSFNFRGVILMFVHINISVSSVWMFFRLYAKVRKKNVITNSFRYALILYGMFLIIGSMIATIIDMKDGKSTIVYICAILGVSGLLVLNPRYFRWVIISSFSIVVLSSMFFTSFSKDIIIEEIHLCMIIIIAIIINHKNYRYNLIAYEKEKMIYVDPLTQAYNRRKMDEDVEKLLENDRIHYVGLVDCDNFKGINDTYGHKFGDEVLINIVMKLQKRFGNESVYRYGGDEFAIITVSSGNSISNYIDSVNAELREEYGDMKISISAGFALVENGINMFQEADTVLYEAKKDKNCCIVKK